jgi:hypothetical protein
MRNSISKDAPTLLLPPELRLPPPPPCDFENSDSSFEKNVSKELLSSPTPPPKKCVFYDQVRFSEQIDIHEAPPHLNGMSKKEKEIIWYGSKDYKRIRKEGLDTLQLVRDGVIYQNCEQYCLDGIENETHAYARHRSLHKLMYLGLVLNAQKDQKAQQRNDPEELAKVYSSFCSRCRHTLFVAGLRNDRNNKRGIMN